MPLVVERQAQLTVAQKIVGLAVVGGDAVLADGLAVLFRRIALVALPVVLGIFQGEAIHIIVAEGLWIIDIFGTAAAAAKSIQSCPTLCDPIDDSPPGSLIPGILQARTLE